MRQKRSARSSSPHGAVFHTLQYNIPKFQVSGNYELSLSADGVSSESLSGKALNVKAENCNTGDMYATIKWVPVSASAQQVTGIIIANGDIKAAAETAATYQLNVLGIKGSIDNRMLLVDGVTFEIDPTLTGVTLSNGTITIEDTATAGEAIITATYGDFSDSIKLTIA